MECFVVEGSVDYQTTLVSFIFVLTLEYKRIDIFALLLASFLME